MDAVNERTARYEGRIQAVVAQIGPVAYGLGDLQARALCEGFDRKKRLKSDRFFEMYSSLYK